MNAHLLLLLRPTIQIYFNNFKIVKLQSSTKIPGTKFNNFLVLYSSHTSAEWQRLASAAQRPKYWQVSIKIATILSQNVLYRQKSSILTRRACVFPLRRT